MTVVAAIARGGRIVMAADRQTNYGVQAIYGAQKIRRLTVGKDEVLIACSGNGGLLAVLQRNLYDALVGAAVPDADAELVEVQRWADTIAAAATEVLAATQPPLLEASSDGSSQSIDGAVLLGWGGYLFYLFTHQAVLVPDGIASLGSGSELALGVMHTALELGNDPEGAACRAVHLACRFVDGCGLGQHTGVDVATL